MGSGNSVGRKRRVRGHTLPYVSNSTELSRKKQNRRKVRRGSFFLGAWGRKSRAEIERERERERECVCVLIKRVQRGRAGESGLSQSQM